MVSEAPQAHPLRLLEAWIDAAREADLPEPASVAFVTADGQGRPSARTVTLKRVEAESLVFTSALWTRKAREIAVNPHVALLFHWPSLGRQVHVTAEARVGPRPLAEELFDQRDLPNRWQAIVSRQGEPIESLDRLRDRLAHLTAIAETPPRCPPDWGALELTPSAVEFWQESDDRLHERRLFLREGDGWTSQLLAP